MINQFHVGNAVDVLEQFDPASIDLVITSPPYDNYLKYKGFDFDAESIFKSLHRVMKEGAVCVWVISDTTIKGSQTGSSFRQALMAKEVGFNLHDTMIFQKKNPAFPRSNGYTKCFEYMFILSKGKPKTFNPIKVPTVIQSGSVRGSSGRNSDDTYGSKVVKLNTERTKNNIWEYSVGGGLVQDKVAFKHPALFPQQLAIDHILSWSNEGDVVLDPMCGSGTVCKMAKYHNRRWVGIDISEEYIHEIAEPRMRELI